MEIIPEPKKLYYRPHIKWLYHALLWFSIVAEAAVLITAAILIFSGKNGWPLAIVGSLGPLLVLFERWWIYRPLAYSFVQVFPDRIRLDNLGKRIEIPFASIQAVKFSYVPYVGGWFSVVASNRKKPFRFTVVLERSETILDAIAASRPEAVDLNKLTKYRRTAIYCDHSWSRMYRKARGWPSILLKYILLPAAVTVVFLLAFHQRSAVRIGFQILPVTMVVGLLFYIFEEMILGRRLRKVLLVSPSSVKRVEEEERVTQRKVKIAYYLFAVAAYIALFIYQGLK